MKLLNINLQRAAFYLGSELQQAIEMPTVGSTADQLIS